MIEWSDPAKTTRTVGARGTGLREQASHPAAGRYFGAVTLREVLRLVEIAYLLGVTKQRADQLRRRPDFPAPVDRYSRGDLWAASDVSRWARMCAGGEARWGPRYRSHLRDR